MRSIHPHKCQRGTTLLHRANRLGSGPDCESWYETTQGCCVARMPQARGVLVPFIKYSSTTACSRDPRPPALPVRVSAVLQMGLLLVQFHAGLEPEDVPRLKYSTNGAPHPALHPLRLKYSTNGAPRATQRAPPCSPPTARGSNRKAREHPQKQQRRHEMHQQWWRRRVVPSNNNKSTNTVQSREVQPACLSFCVWV